VKSIEWHVKENKICKFSQDKKQEQLTVCYYERLELQVL
jgi:hypothetical protein